MAVSVLASLFVGSLLLIAQSGSWRLAIATFTTKNGVANFAAILALVVVPASLPMTVVGGVIAARALAREPLSRRVRYWVTRGCAWGSLLGVVGSSAWFGAINFGESESGLVSFLLFMGLMGGLAGGIVGSIVGAYLWYASHSATRAVRSG
jgi:hypothetical protein